MVCVHFPFECRGKLSPQSRPGGSPGLHQDFEEGGTEPCGSLRESRGEHFRKRNSKY
jgi:hypothetical protein